MQIWFGGRNRESFYLMREDGAWVFPDALRTLGRLTHEEVYGFIPPVAVSGIPDNSRVEKLHAVVQTAILAKVPSQVTIMAF